MAAKISLGECDADQASGGAAHSPSARRVRPGEQPADQSGQKPEGHQGERPRPQGWSHSSPLPSLPASVRACPEGMAHAD